MRLTGFSFKGQTERPDDEMFRDVMRRAVALLRGDGLPPEETDEQRDRLLAGFRWILVDEYQDIGAEQYELISALAGRTLADDHGKLTLFAVGDDDQNIYAFNGTSVEFIRRFETDYGPRPKYLTENYRSSSPIVAAANAVIEPARERMKTEHPIRINRARAKHSPGGEWERLDPVSRGKVQILPAGRDPISQARSVMAEFQRLAKLAPKWDWSRCAVIAPVGQGVTRERTGHRGRRRRRGVAPAGVGGCPRGLSGGARRATAVGEVAGGLTQRDLPP